MKKYFTSLMALATIFVSQSPEASAQDWGNLSGDIMSNVNFFQRDSTIGASGNPLYNNLLSGGENWMSLRYSNYGFTGFIRLDAFNNSNLQTPTQAMSGFGIGAWSISKEYKNLTVTGGYIYDQIGSGILFRSYEDRGLLIDNALEGIELKYQLMPNFTVKGFTGQQKNVFTRYQPIIKGLNFEGDFQAGKKVHLAPGIGILNRTLDKSSVDNIVNNINNLAPNERFAPKYNMYAFTLYNTLTVGDISWYIEAALKSKEAVNDNVGQLHNKSGNIVYSTLSYARKGFALTLTGKRTDGFVMRTSPNEILANSGMLNWQPILAQIRPQRLIARYTPASLDFSEVGGSANALFSPNDNIDLSLWYTHINTLDKLKLYREVYAEANFRNLGNALLDVGLQYLEYNYGYYRIEPTIGMVYAFTPFAELTYKINNQQSFKVNAQYMNTKQDFGSWAYLGLEYAVSPHWSFAASDMYNTDPQRKDLTGRHYYNIFAAYTAGAHRFTIAYTKQVEGVNCSGGVCRYEPAFSGVKVGITSSF